MSAEGEEPKVTVELFDDEMLEAEPRPVRKPRKPRKKRRRDGGETAKRILIALPWIVFAIAITIAGGIVFTLAMIAIGVVALREFDAIAKRYRPLVIPAYIAVAGLVLAAHFGTAFNVLYVLAAAFALIFAFAARPQRQQGATVSIGVTLLGVLWIGIPLAHAVLLRDLPSHGAALFIGVLVGT